MAGKNAADWIGMKTTLAWIGGIALAGWLTAGAIYLIGWIGKK